VNRVRPLRKRARWLTAVAVAIVAAAGMAPGTAAGSAAPSGTGERAPSTDAALDVRLTSMSPSTVPKSGRLRLKGTVTNASTQDWQSINVHAFVSRFPITTPEELAVAAALPYDADVGDRLQTTNAFVAIGDLGPGETARFSLRVPRSELPIPDRAGVYWVGVHALGASKDGRDGVADGRARTFIPLVRGKKERATVALVLPFRQTVRRDATGKLRRPERWQQLLAPTGRMGRLLRIAESAGAEPLTLVVDPAVLDAVDTVANGSRDPGTPKPAGEPSAGPTATPSGDGDGAAGQAPGPGADRAKDWMTRFHALADSKRVLGLGYADPDVAALSSRSPELLGKGYALGNETFKRYDVRADPAAVPADGYLPVSALPRLGADTVVLLDDTAAPGRRARLRTSSGQPLVVADSATATGGPGPSPATEALALRQRIVAGAALRALSRSPEPLVVMLPADWDPGPSWQRADFFAAMDLPWLQLTGLDTGADAPPRSDLVYPNDRAKAEIGAPLVTATKDAITAAKVFSDALIRSGGVVASFTRQALEGTSYHARANQSTTLAESLDLGRSIRSRLSGIRVVGSSFVIMSGGSVTFGVTLVNDLTQPVRVGLKARTDSSDLTITTPGAVVLPPGQRTLVKLKAQASDIGVREVQLTPVTRQGDAVGTPITVSVRSSQVSSLIWGVMVAGGILLVVMIIRRAVKRGLHREKARS